MKYMFYTMLKEKINHMFHDLKYHKLRFSWSNLSFIGIVIFQTVILKLSVRFPWSKYVDLKTNKWLIFNNAQISSKIQQKLKQ